MPQTWYILSEDKSKNSLKEPTLVTSIAVTSTMGMWGSAMFGEVLILGSGFLNTYLTNDVRYILVEDQSKNVIRRLSSLFNVTPIDLMLQWGAGTFGSDDILGTGTLNYFEG